MAESNFRKDIEEALKGEEVEAVIIATREYEWADTYDIPDEKRNAILSWEAAAPLFDFDYDSGFGGVDCPAIAVYTKTRIILVDVYDGATGLFAVNRDPVEGWAPPMPGGGG